MGLFSWLTGRDEPVSNTNTQPQVDEKEQARINTPYEYRNCMNCANLSESGGTYYCYHGYLNTQEREEIANSHCNTDAWEPRKHGGSYSNYVFSPYNWYQE